MSDYGIDIVPSFGTSDFEVVLFPEDMDAAPVTLGYLPETSTEGDIEFFTFEEELYVFSFADGRWSEERSSEDADIDLRFGSIPAGFFEETA
jgi:hypothetical protein